MMNFVIAKVNQSKPEQQQFLDNVSKYLRLYRERYARTFY